VRAGHMRRVPAVPAILTLALSPPCPACLPQVVSQEQVITFEYQGTNFLLTVASVLVAGATGAGGGAPRGMLAPATAFVFEVAAGAPRGRQLPACLQACGCEVAVVQGCACVSLWVSSTFVRCSEVALMLGQSFTMMCSLSSCPGGLLTTEPLPQPRPVAADPQTSWQLPPSCTHTRTLCEKTGSSAGLRAARAGAGAGLAIKGQRGGATPQLFKHKEVNFERLGIGGLDAQFEAIFRRACSRRPSSSGWASGTSRACCCTGRPAPVPTLRTVLFPRIGRAGRYVSQHPCPGMPSHLTRAVQRWLRRHRPWLDERLVTRHSNKGPPTRPARADAHARRRVLTPAHSRRRCHCNHCPCRITGVPLPGLCTLTGN